MAALDLTTGEFFAGDFATAEALRDALGRLSPAEVVVAQGQRIDLETSALSNGERLAYLLVEHDAWSFSPDAAEHTLRDHFKTASLDGFGLVGSAGKNASHRGALARRAVCCITWATSCAGRSGMSIRCGSGSAKISDSRRRDAAQPGIGRSAPAGRGTDDAAFRGGPDGDIRRRPAAAAMAARAAAGPAAIERRQSVVAWAKANQQERNALQERLRQVRDVERLVARLVQGSGNARDLIALRVSLEQLPGLHEALAKHPVAALRELGGRSLRCPTWRIFIRARWRTIRRLC